MSVNVSGLPGIFPPQSPQPTGAVSWSQLSNLLSIINLDLMVDFQTFRNVGAISVQANQVTGSPFAITTQGRTWLIVVVGIKALPSASNTTSIDIDGTLIAAAYTGATLPNSTSTAVGAIQNLPAGSHALNVKASNAGANVVDSILVYEL